MKLNKFTLTFNNKNIEQKFGKEYYYNSIIMFRVSLAIVTIFYLAFGYFDYANSPIYYKHFLAVRFLIIFPLFLVVFLYSFHKSFIKVWQEILSICFVIGGFGIIYMLWRNPNNIHYYGGMFLIFSAGYFLIKLRFIWAAISGIVLMLTYNIGAFLFKSIYGLQYDYIIIINAFYIAANVISMMSLYNTELLERRDFYQKILLSEKQDEITLINQSLEGEVTDRTRQLNKRNIELEKEIAKRNEIEQELVLAKEKAEESDRLKSAFLANMSHEIRTPMNGILGFADLLEQPMLTNEEQQNYIHIIQKSGARMLNIINHLIDISKVEAGQLNISKTKVNINKEIQYIYKLFKPEVERKNIQFIFNPELTDTESIIETDRKKINTILNNLVKNAIKYTNKGSIEIGCKMKSKHFVFFVKDSGIGISENKQKLIFDHFVQADITDTRAYQGAGLGLSVSKAFVEILGGKIWVDSKEGKGSEFFFTLPHQNSTINS